MLPHTNFPRPTSARAHGVRSSKHRLGIPDKLFTTLGVAVVTLGLALGSAASAYAITNGQPDGTRHPYAGLADNGLLFCSGSLLSATVFLTAAHCFDDGQRIRITFDEQGFFNASRLSFFGTAHNNPLFCFSCTNAAAGPTFDTHDHAVVVLDAPVPPAVVGRYVQLPAQGLVDRLPMDTAVTVVGYGVQGFVRGGGPPRDGSVFTRFFAETQLVQNNNTFSPEFLNLSTNPSKGMGGFCSGDSGGPDLLGSTDTVLSINTFVTNSNCTGLSFSTRMDTPAALSFVAQFFP
jgi:secreted trypsin-like serine protease